MNGDEKQKTISQMAAVLLASQFGQTKIWEYGSGNENWDRTADYCAEMARLLWVTVERKIEEDLDGR